MKFLSQLFEARGTDLTSKSFRFARRKLISIYLLIIAVVIILFSYLVLVQVTQRELAQKLPPHSEILLNSNDARSIAQQEKPGVPVLGAEYEIKNRELLYEVYFADGESIYVDVLSGTIISNKGSQKIITLYHTLTDDTYEIIAWLGIIVFIIASAGSIFIANATLKPIAQSIQKQKRFVSDAAHELRNPLASLQTTLESYARSKDKTVKLSESVTADLLDEVKRLIATSEALLAFESYEKNPETIQNCVLEKNLTDVLGRLEPYRLEKNIAIHQKISPDTVRFKPHDLSSVLYNLLHNALKFSNNDSHIHVSWDGHILVVADSGRGIAPEHLGHIFERFYKVENARSFDGHSNGLGLALVYEIVTSYGGTIKVESELGRGTTFRVTFIS